MLSKSMDCFLYHRDLSHERVNVNFDQILSHILHINSSILVYNFENIFLCWVERYKKGIITYISVKVESLKPKLTKLYLFIHQFEERRKYFVSVTSGGFHPRVSSSSSSIIVEFLSFTAGSNKKRSHLGVYLGSCQTSMIGFLQN